MMDSRRMDENSKNERHQHERKHDENEKQHREKRQMVQRNLMRLLHHESILLPMTLLILILPQRTYENQLHQVCRN